MRGNAACVLAYLIFWVLEVGGSHIDAFAFDEFDMMEHEFLSCIDEKAFVFNKLNE